MIAFNGEDWSTGDVVGFVAMVFVAVAVAVYAAWRIWVTR